MVNHRLYVWQLNIPCRGGCQMTPAAAQFVAMEIKSNRPFAKAVGYFCHSSNWDEPSINAVSFCILMVTKMCWIVKCFFALKKCGASHQLQFSQGLNCNMFFSLKFTLVTVVKSLFSITLWVSVAGVCPRSAHIENRTCCYPF